MLQLLSFDRVQATPARSEALELDVTSHCQTHMKGMRTFQAELSLIASIFDTKVSGS